VAAEERLREALDIVEVLLKQEPENQRYIHQQGMLLTELGNTLRTQGRYRQARTAYQQSLLLASQLGDVRGQAIVLGELGTVAREERDYDEALTYYAEVRDRLHALGESASEAIAWYQLGRVVQEQENWQEAERCYRMGLELGEQHGNPADTASTYNELAFVVWRAGRPAEAEGWYKRALEWAERERPGSLAQAEYLNNLAVLLVGEVLASRVQPARLAEAREYAEEALRIRESLDASAGPWRTLGILSHIARMEGQIEMALAYQRRARETFAAFVGNRYHIDREHEPLIHAVVAVVKGNTQLRAKVEDVLSKYEKNDWRISNVIQRLWAGERDWHTLAEELDWQEALLILRILETLEQPPMQDE
jgi:tetratricopeptide (TPR) repeat protein